MVKPRDLNSPQSIVAGLTFRSMWIWYDFVRGIRILQLLKSQWHAGYGTFQSSGGSKARHRWAEVFKHQTKHPALRISSSQSPVGLFLQPEEIEANTPANIPRQSQRNQHVIRLGANHRNAIGVPVPVQKNLVLVLNFRNF